MNLEQPNSPKLAFSINEVVAQISIGKTTLYEAIGDGRLKMKKIGRRSLILKEDLDAFLKRLESYPSKVGDQ